MPHYLTVVSNLQVRTESTGLACSDATWLDPELFYVNRAIASEFRQEEANDHLPFRSAKAMVRPYTVHTELWNSRNFL